MYVCIYIYIYIEREREREREREIHIHIACRPYRCPIGASFGPLRHAGRQAGTRFRRHAGTRPVKRAGHPPSPPSDIKLTLTWPTK